MLQRMGWGQHTENGQVGETTGGTTSPSWLGAPSDPTSRAEGIWCQGCFPCESDPDEREHLSWMRISVCLDPQCTFNQAISVILVYSMFNELTRTPRNNRSCEAWSPLVPLRQWSETPAWTSCGPPSQADLWRQKEYICWWYWSFYVDTKHWFKYLSRNTAVPPRTVKTAAKALSSWPQRCVEGNQALIHNCTDSSVQLINSRPTYMSSKDSDSHIIAAEGGEEAERKDRWRFGF